MNSDRIYVGKARAQTFRNGDVIYKVWLTPDGLEDINKNCRPNGGINLIVSEMRQPDRIGNTHTVYIDDWVPESRRGADGNAGTRRQAPGNAAPRGGRNDGGFGAPAQQSRYDRNDEPESNYSAPSSTIIDDDIPF